MHTGNINYRLKLRMWDYDFWSSNDLVADGSTWEYNDGSSIVEFYHTSSSAFHHIIHDDNIDNETNYQTIVK